MLSAQISGGQLGFFPVDQIKDAGSAVVNAVKDAANWIADSFEDVADFVQKYGCTIINNDIVVMAVAGGTSLVASPAAGAAVTSGAAVGQKACKVLSVSQAVLQQIKAKASPVQPPPNVAPVFAQAQSVIIRARALVPSPGTTAVTPSLAPPATPTSKYKVGSVTRYNRTRGIWTVYSPLNGILGCSSCQHSLGDGEVSPPMPAGFVKAGEELVPPQGVTQGGQEEDKKSLLKNPYFWLAVGGGVVAVGGTGYLLLRRRRKA